MELDAATPKRTVILTLDDHLVRQAEQHTADLNRTLEELLMRYVSTRRIPNRAEQEQLDRTIDFFNELRARDGLLSDQFPSF